MARKILVIGGGGREHALCWSIAKSQHCQSLACAPGNAGIADVATCIDISATDIDRLLAYSVDNAIDFVVVGPEEPLVEGVVDALTAENILTFGPTAKAAAIEGSKALMKDICTQREIPTASYQRFDEPDAAKEHIHRHGAPIVVKADGLAAGKGAIVCRNDNEAFAAIDHILIEKAFGDAGKTVIIEDFLEGEEVSFFALAHGRRAVALTTAQDHKAAYDGDEGPNTGGMGAYSPATVITPDLQQEIMDKVIHPTLAAMDDKGMPYTGVLFAGLIMTSQGPKLLEYNVRFGDPECQAIVLRLKSDLLETLIATAEGDMDDINLAWHKDASLVVVMATHGYPGPYAKGSEIIGLQSLNGFPGLQVFHSGTKKSGDKLLANGGRVLGVTAVSPTIREAREAAYRAIEKIDWPQGFFRRDIGWRVF